MLSTSSCQEGTESDVPMPSDEWKAYLPALQAFVHLGLCSAGELTKLIAEMHATVASSPGLTLRPFRKTHFRDAPYPYRLVMGSFYGLSRIFSAIPTNELEPGSRRFIQLRAALNGVAGDKLDRWRNKLAQEMVVTDIDGAQVHLKKDDRQALVIFIHGLCHSDVEWQSEAHDRYVDACKANGQQVCYLRYNTGLNIYENGARLSQLLEQTIEKRPLTLIGHSMGGLVIRSAAMHAGLHQYKWLQHLTTAVYLGSPHLGSPLERSGNLVNALLTISPYARPFTRLGNIRSKGIRDLRHGYITEEESTQGEPVARDVRLQLEELSPHTSHILIAGVLPKAGPLGDGLVPVASALAQPATGALTLSAPNILRYQLSDLGHIAMLTDPRVYDLLTHAETIGVESMGSESLILDQ